MTSRTVDPTRVRSVKLQVMLASLGCALLASACSWGGIGTQPDPPKITPAPVSTPLGLDERVHDAVDCSAGECLRRYQITLSQSGELRVQVDPQLQSGELVRVILQDPVGNVMGRQSTDEPGRSIRLGGPAQPGFYQVMIQSSSGTTQYELVATLDTSGAPQTTQLEADVAQMTKPPPRPTVPATNAASNAPPANDPTKADQGFVRNPNVDLAKYRSYAFASDPQQLLKAQPGAYIGNPFIDQQIQNAIRFVLADSDYFLTSPEQAEFLVNFHTGRSSMAYFTYGGVVYNYSYATAYGTWMGYPGYFGGPIRTSIETQGTLVIDIIDIATKQLVWNGWATRTTGWQDNEAVIKSAVKEILANFPGD